MSHSTNDTKVLKWAAGILGGLFAVTALSQTKLQTLERSHTIDLADSSNRYTVTVTDYAKRGSILASDLKPLAQNDRSSELIVEFDKVPHSDAFFLELAQATGIPASEFSDLAYRGEESRTWSQAIDGDHYDAVMELRKRWRADGVSLKGGGRRRYPLREGAASFVGVMRDLDTGPMRLGFESSLNPLLAGKDGYREGLTDRSGAFLPMRMEQNSVVAKNGQDVVLTIDREMQAVAAESIKQAVVTNKADNGVALVMDPKTGDILAMANWPSFDPESTGDQGGIGYNPNYMAQLEPGSMFKILTLAKGIEDGKVSLTDSLNCTGEWKPTKSSVIHCDKHHGNRAHGQVTTVDAIARSCNVSAAIWATKVGEQNFFDFIAKLKLVDHSTLCLPGEIGGRLTKAKYAQRLQLATLGFGQSITCTPVGLLGAFGMIGNNGVRVEPRLIKRIGATDITPDKGTEVVRPDTAHQVMECMEAVVQSGEGTGAKLRIPGYRLAGKTGTAEKIGKGQHGYVSNFVGFVPAPDPRAVILVMVNNPKGNLYYGADVAGPVFSSLANAVISHFNLPRTEALDAKPARKPVLDATVQVQSIKRGIATR